MTKPRHFRSVLALAGLSASLIVGGAIAGPGVAGATAGAGGGAGVTPNHALAVVVAARRFAEVTLPAGARSQSGPPAGSGSLLKRPAEAPVTPNKVDDAGFAVVPGRPGAVIKWFVSHMPTGSKLIGTGKLAYHGVTELWDAVFAWPGVHDVLFSESVVVATVRLPGDRTGLRFDSQVTWLPKRSPLDNVPAGAKVVTVIVAVPRPDGAPGQRLEPTIVTRNGATISQITADVDHLEVLLPGPHPCPPGPDLDIYVEFRPRPGSAPDDVTTAYPYGCAFVNQEANGQTSPQTLVLGSALTRQLKQLVGLKLPPVPPGIHGG